EAQARTAEHNVFGVGRPRAVSIVARRVCQLLEVTTVRSDREDVKCILGSASETDAVSGRRPGGEIVVIRCEFCNRAVLQVQGAETAFLLGPNTIHDLLSIRRPTRKATVDGPAGEVTLF